MKKLIKYVIPSFSVLLFATSCISDDDFVIPTVKAVINSQDFESITTGSGSNEVAVTLDGWINTNQTNTRVWAGKTFDNNKFAEFSSFYSASGAIDNAWLITEKLDLSKTPNKALSFTSVNRYYNGSVLKLYISEDFDGTIAGINNATWIELEANLPSSSAQNDATVPSGNIDLSAYNSNSAYLAFKYVGAKTAGPTTTFQLDNIVIFEN